MASEPHEETTSESWRRLGFRQAEDRFRGRESLNLRCEFIQRTAALILSVRPDLQGRFGDDPSTLEFWCWLNSFGVGEFDLLRDLLAPVPPREVFQFVGSDTEFGYLETGANGYRMIADLLADQGLRIDDVKCALDFGAGPGRMIRYFMRHAATTGIVGVDVDERAIQWAQENFTFGEFLVSAPEPPLPFPDGSFDLIYAVSVFSHLSEANHLSWLSELHRVAAPDATVILTVLGPHAHSRLTQERAFREWSKLESHQLDNAASELRKRGFSFVRQESGHLNRDIYGVAFVGRKYIETHWASQFNFIGYREAAIDNNQDAVVLRPRK